VPYSYHRNSYPTSYQSSTSRANAGKASNQKKSGAATSPTPTLPSCTATCANVGYALRKRLIDSTTLLKSSNRYSIPMGSIADAERTFAARARAVSTSLKPMISRTMVPKSSGSFRGSRQYLSSCLNYRRRLYRREKRRSSMAAMNPQSKRNPSLPRARVRT